MKWIPTDLHRSAGVEDLRGFLEACRDEAEESGHYKIVSISLATDYLDGLAVLGAIYDPHAWHFYAEHPDRGEFIAGAEAVVLHTAQGPDRFSALRRFVDEVRAHTVAIGDLDQPGAGPHFYFAAPFDENVESDDPFPGATVFLPHWQVSCRGNRYCAVANCRIDAHTDIAKLTERLDAARRRFRSFRYDEPVELPELRVIERKELISRETFQAIVETALREIDLGSIKKIVLARAMDLRFSGPCRPLTTLHRLKRQFPNCLVFSIENGNGESFIGATPESLLSLRDGVLRTEAIAGSVRRGATPGEDARLARELLESDKDRREHQLVIDSIRRRLADLGVSLEPASEPRLLTLPNVRHLHTPLQGEVSTDIHILDFAAALHPTPAVGGTPREAALERIREWEPFSRSLYSGVVGWFDHTGSGELSVNLRCALVKGDHARIFAGAGIVNGSDPAAEFRETQVKMEALLGAIQE